MRPGFFVFVTMVLFFVSCDQQQSGNKVKKSISDRGFPEEREFVPDIPPPPVPYTGPKTYCFEKREGENNEDLTKLQMTVDNDSITGTLDYFPNQRPATHGKIEGLMLGKIIHLVYTYQMDGQPRKEQLIYKFESNKLFKKTGELILDEDTWVLKDPSAAQFQLSLEKVDCKGK